MKIIISLSRAAFFSAVLITSLFILSAASFAATFTVTNLNDMGAGSLRQAILDANANMNGPGTVDDIVFAFGVTGTIPSDVAFSGEMDITDDVTISGPGAGVITIDAQTVDRIFNIDSTLGDIDVSISGLRFINGGGVSTGGAILNEEELFIDSCVFEGNEADSSGAIRNNGTINTITHSTFSGNMAVVEGGAILNGGNINTITHSTFSGNMAFRGGAIFNDDGGIIGEITHSIFNVNMAEFGGAIWNAPSATITKITHSTFDGNSAISSSGAIRNFGTITAITNSTFRGNIASFGSNGAIFNGGTMNISFTTIANNAGPFGGGIHNTGTLNIKNSIVANNTVGDDCDGAVTALGVNLDTDGSCPGFTTVTSAALNLDPAGLQDKRRPDRNHRFN